MKNQHVFLCGLAMASATLLFAASQLEAQIIASDDFESYTAGALAGQGGGTGWGANTWLAPGATGSGNVVGASLDGSQALQLFTSGTASTIMSARQLGTGLTGQDFYVGYLWQYAGGNGFAGNSTLSLFLSDTATGTGTSAINFGMRSTTGTQTFMVRSGTGTPPVGAALTLAGNPVGNPSETYQLVAKYVWNPVGGASGTGAYTTVNAWFNPSAGPEPAADITMTLASGGLSTINYAFFREGAPSAGDVFNVDDLTLGQTFGDIVPVPEPSAIALGALALTAIFICRRRGSRTL